MKKYPKYKPSGVEWIGEIPERWEMKKIKYLCSVKGRVGWKGLKASQFLVNGYAYLITGTDFKDGLIDWENCYHIDKERYDEDPYIQLKEDDLLLTKDGTIGKLAIVKNLDKPACLNSGIFVVRSLINNLLTRYLYWILRSTVFNCYNEYTSYGSTIQHLYQNVFVEFNFCFPSFKEQIAIANYLDDKTARIDALIDEKKKKLIELYKEERAAVINRAVTSGIDPNVKLKPSGLSAPTAPAGQAGAQAGIPEHWEVKKLKYVVKVKSGDGIKSEQIDFEGTYPVYGGNGIMGYTEDYNYNRLNIIIGRVGAKCGNVRLVDGKKWISDNALVVELLEGYDYKFISILLDSINLNSLANQNAQPLITGTLVRDKIVAIPTKTEEQHQIVQHIETETKRIDEKIGKTEKEIELLQEYRTALISEVVTGKICVYANQVNQDQSRLKQ